jgi:CheY-specific phosphatase CheX
MNPQFQMAMKDAISRVLETMFFTAAAFEDGVKINPGQTMPYCCESSIGIHGEEQSFRMFWLATDRFAKMITANFLGVSEQQVEASEVSDTMKELANMVAGEFVARIGQGSWQLGIPGFEQLDAHCRQYPAKELVCLHVGCDGEPMALVLYCQDD